jgi:hypothetical protein
VGLAAQHRPFDLEIAVLVERLRHVDDQKIGEQHLGQRMSTFRVKRTLSLKYPPSGIAMAAGFVQSFCTSAFLSVFVPGFARLACGR